MKTAIVIGVGPDRGLEPGFASVLRSTDLR